MLTLEPGTRLDRYELLCLLAQGGMANVWLARLETRAGFRKLVAIKTILPHVAHDPQFKVMFLDEAGIASRINHPNVVRMADVGEFAGIPYLVMDLVEGEPLFRLPKACERVGRRIPLGVVLRILADACHGLHAAHELRNDQGTLLGVVHRDMSPQNILVSSAGVSLVIDFGVAKAIDRSAQQTSAGTLKGKISYMPPEQARGLEVDRRSDTWALGAVLYYLLAGRPPYKEESQLATLQLAMSGAPVPPLPESMPASLRSVVMRALSQDPEERYQSASDLGDDVESLMRRLNVQTSHSEVGSFFSQVMHERLAARRQLIGSALAEASNRESARTMLAKAQPRERVDEPSSLNESVVSIPLAPVPMSEPHLIGAPPGLSPGFDAPLAPPVDRALPSAARLRGGVDGPHEPSTAGAFVAFSEPPFASLPPKARVGWATFAAAGALGVSGAALIIASLVTPSKPHAPAAGGAAAAVALPGVGSAERVGAPAVTPVSTWVPSSAAVVPAAVPPAPLEPPAPPVMPPPVAASLTPPAPPPPAAVSAAPVALAPPPASSSPAAVTSPPSPAAPKATNQPARAPRSSGTSPKKRRDDEAGF